VSLQRGKSGVPGKASGDLQSRHKRDECPLSHGVA
jgi:hypothetical protein